MSFIVYVCSKLVFILAVAFVFIERELNMLVWD